MRKASRQLASNRNDAEFGMQLAPPIAVGGRLWTEVDYIDMQNALTILVVDDEFTVRRWVSQLLQRSGYSVLEAHSGPDAIRVSDQHHGPIDLLLSDILMPGGMTGDEVAAILKRLRPTMKVVLMSGYHQNVIAGETSWPFIPKPFQSATLIERVKHALAEDH